MLCNIQKKRLVKVEMSRLHHELSSKTTREADYMQVVQHGLN